MVFDLMDFSEYFDSQRTQMHWSSGADGLGWQFSQISCFVELSAFQSIANSVAMN